MEMKQIRAICRAELSQLFFSPAAWIIIVIFSFQVYGTFMEGISSLADDLELFGGAGNITYTLFARVGGLWSTIKSNLYMFIPLLTMGLMSRDMGSGAIKLLYSSPVTSFSIVLGKFLSMMVLSFIMIGLTVPAITFTAATVPDADYGLMFSGMAGQFLLFWAYSSIGLFMSCLTSYQIVAAILTLVTLGFLNMIGSMWQKIAVVRDLTYWASLSGRTSQFTAGLISTEDIIYFLIVITLFFSWSVFLLQFRRDRRLPACVMKYVGTTAALVALGYISSRPFAILYHDATQTKANTLTAGSIKAVDGIQGRLDITTYVNVADYDCWSESPEAVNADKERFKMYLRFHPDIRMKYVYFYDEPLHNQDYGNSGWSTEELAMKMAEGLGVPWRKVLPPEEIRRIIDLSGEKNHVVKQMVTEDGRRTWLRLYDDMMKYPGEQEITTALNRLENGALTVGFLTGHGERSIIRDEDGDYSGFSSDADSRSALVNTGFDVMTVNADSTIDADILVAADPEKPLTEAETANLMSYVNAGGNLLLTVEQVNAGLLDSILSYLGISVGDSIITLPGSPAAPELIPGAVTAEASALCRQFMKGMPVSMPSAAALTCSATSPWNVVPLLALPDSTVLAWAMSRDMGGKSQRIVVAGDADCLSNMEMSIKRKSLKAYNSRFCTGVFNWLSDGKLPVNISREEPVDNEIHITRDSAFFWALIFKWLLPGLLSIIGIMLTISRRRR